MATSRDVLAASVLEPAADIDRAVRLKYYGPPDDLRPLIGAIYVFGADRPIVRDVTRADFAQLRFMITGRGDYTFHDGRVQPTPEVCMLGPTMGATRFEVGGPVMVIGVALLPLGWAALTGREAVDHADDLFDMEAAFGPDYRDMLEKLRRLPDPHDAPALLWGFLRDRMRRLPRGLTPFTTQVDAWLMSERSPRLSTLQAATGLSTRQIARLTNKLYGASPKLLARKYRALRCASLIGAEGRNWDDFVEETFYDQSHFIREMKHFVGLTPHQLKSAPTIVARLTLLRRELEGELPPISLGS